MVHSILARASSSQVREEPFPHLVLEEALPEAYYAELEASYPGLDFVAGGASLENNAAYLKSAVDVVDHPAVAAPWREFFAYHSSEAFFREVCGFWREWIERLHPGLRENFGKPLSDFSVGVRRPGKRENSENQTADVMVDCQFGTNSPVTRVSSVRGPHLDNRAKLYAALLYFRHPEDASSGGDLELYRVGPRRYPKRRMAKIDPRSVERAARVDYAPNRLVMWINSAWSVHGVSPRSVTGVPRRYVNFLGECYAGRRDDFFTAFPPRRLSARGLLDRLRA